MAPKLETAKTAYETMCALGTAANSPAAWRTMAALLTEAALVAPPGMARPLLDRSDDCVARAAHVAAIRAGVPESTRLALDILRANGSL